jgi:hypothetical protein
MNDAEKGEVLANLKFQWRSIASKAMHKKWKGAEERRGRKSDGK